MQPVGINIHRFFELMVQYPNSSFSTIVDNEEIILKMNTLASEKKLQVSLWLDINNGMNRTGITPNNEAVLLYQKMSVVLNLIAKVCMYMMAIFMSLTLTYAQQICDKDFDLVVALKSQIEQLGIKIKTIVAGGTPTFPIHIKRDNIEVCPGTPLLWDQGYADTYKDLKFLPAAVLVGAIVSKPSDNLICLNLGHKSVAAEMPPPRLKSLNFEKLEHISHSEEHLVVECVESKEYAIGTICYAIPTHICPTVLKYDTVLTVIDGTITGHWNIAARDHILN